MWLSSLSRFSWVAQQLEVLEVALPPSALVVVEECSRSNIGRTAATEFLRIFVMNIFERS